MIVTDADVISYFWLDVERTAAAREARRCDEVWAAPVLWKSEFRNVLSQHIRHRGLSLADALRLATNAEVDLEGSTYEVPSTDVLRLVDASGHSSYDCEYVALAQQLGVSLVTGDRQVVKNFPETAVLLEEYASKSE